MIHHISIAAEKPQHVAEVLAELWQGQVAPFPPHPGSYVMFAMDEYGTMIEIYPIGTELLPSIEAVGFTHTANKSGYSASHAAISIPASQPDIERIAVREGWCVRRCNRENIFEVIEFWVENRVLLELLPPAIAPQYLAFMQPQNLKRIFEEMALAH